MSDTFLFYDFKVTIRFTVINFTLKDEVSPSPIYDTYLELFLPSDLLKFVTARPASMALDNFVWSMEVVFIFPVVVVYIILPF